MPYTFIHPVFMGPLRQRWPRIFDFSALVMGSIAPDVDIIYRFTNTRHHIFDYSLWNVLTMILPIAVLMSIFLRVVMLPVYQTGNIHLSRSVVGETFRKLPSIIFTAFIAIQLHLFLDNITHIDDIINKAKFQAENLGREPDDYHDFYYLMMYGPTLAVSGLGMVMALWYAWMYRVQLLALTKFIRLHFRKWAMVFTLLLVSFSLLKHITVGVEDQMRIDSYAISITCGLLSAFLLSPVLFFIRFRLLQVWLQKLPDVSRKWYLHLMPIVGLYLLGIPNTDWLREFTLKGIFLMGMSAIPLLAREVISQYKFHHSLYNWLMMAVLFAVYTSAVKLSPAWWWVKFILAIQGIMTIIYALSKMLFPTSMVTRTLHVFTGGSLLFVLAYYVSDKGIGPGILVVSLMGILYAWRNQLIDTGSEISGKKVFFFAALESTLMMLLVVSLKTPAAVLMLIGVVLTYLRRWGLSTQDWAGRFNILYQWWLPISGIFFLAERYSLAYGLLALSGYFIFFPTSLANLWDAYRMRKKPDSVIMNVT